MENNILYEQGCTVHSPLKNNYNDLENDLYNTTNADKEKTQICTHKEFKHTHTNTHTVNYY